MSDGTDVGFVCECGSEVEEIWEQLTLIGGQAAYRCPDCGRRGKWVCDPLDADKSGITGCLVRRAEVNHE